MPRNRGGKLTKAGSAVFAVRLDGELAAAVDAAAGGHEHFAEWARRLFHAATLAKTFNYALGPAQAAGYDEGKRQGWAHANAVFREALKAAVAELK